MSETSFFRMVKSCIDDDLAAQMTVLFPSCRDLVGKKANSYDEPMRQDGKTEFREHPIILLLVSLKLIQPVSISICKTVYPNTKISFK